MENVNSCGCGFRQVLSHSSQVHSARGRRNAHSKNLQSSQAPSRVWRHGKGLSPRLLPAAGPTYSLSCNVAGLSVQRAGDQLRAVAQGFECSNITITTSLTSFSFAHNNTFSFCSRLPPPPPPPDSKGLCHWSEAFLKFPHSAGEQRVKIQEF